MSPIKLNQLLRHEAFRGLSEPAQQRLSNGMKLLSFELGEPLVEAGVIPGRVLILLEGRARLVGNDQGRLISLGKFDPGAVLGAASLLCGRNCENLIASEAVTAASISDELWAELYGTEDSFRDWCDRQLWGQEVITLLQDLQQDNARTEGTSLGFLQDSLRDAQRVPIDPDAIQAAQGEQRQVFVVSTRNGSTPGQLLQEGEVPPNSQPFPARLISLPAALVEKILSSACLLYTSPSPRDRQKSRMPSSA